MPRTEHCHLPECSAPIRESDYRVRFIERVFCCDNHASSWVVQNDAFKVAADPMPSIDVRHHLRCGNCRYTSANLHESAHSDLVVEAVLVAGLEAGVVAQLDGAQRVVLRELVAVGYRDLVGAIGVALGPDELLDGLHTRQLRSVYTEIQMSRCAKPNSQGAMMTHKQIEAGLRSQADWHNTKATRLAHLAYRAKSDAFRSTMLAKAEEHSKQAVEAMRHASEMVKSDEAAAKKQAKKRKEKPSKKQRSGSRKR